MPTYGYNYPWSGRLGCLTDCCIYCGDKGPKFQMSSRGSSCLGQDCPAYDNPDAEPIPELQARMMANYERKARLWCREKGIDYDATVKNYFDNLGPPLQKRDTPIPNAGRDYSVYLPKDNCEVCKGESGGVLGNENLVEVNGAVVIMCDFCSVKHEENKNEKQKDGEGV